MLEEPSLAELPTTSGELKEVWVRSTGSPLDPEMVQKARWKEMDFMLPLRVSIPLSVEESREQAGSDAVA